MTATSVYVCACTYACMYVCMYVYMHALHACTYACTHVCMNACTYVYMHYAQTDVCIYMFCDCETIRKKPMHVRRGDPKITGI
jgi:hypothetical protein